MTRQEQAYQAGQWAAEEGRGIDKRPQYGMGQEFEPLRKAWERGWTETNVKMGRTVRKNAR